MAAEKELSYLYLEESLHDRETEIGLLRKTFSEIGNELDLDTVFQIVSDRALELINAETVLIPILDDNCETYTYRGGSGVNAEEIVGESLPLEYGVCGWVWRNRKPWWQGVLDELNEEERNLWEKEAGTMILVPLQGKQHFLGGIAGINKTTGPEFTKKDLDLLTMFASIVAIIIENAMAVKKIEETQKINEENHLRLEKLNKQLLESNRELQFLSLYDTLTSLPNRNLFSDRLTQHINLAKSVGGSCSVLLIDLNDFKQLNEAFGHDIGDRVLKMISQRLNDHVGSLETIARLGGDEFIIIYPDTDRKSICRHAKDILHLLEKRIEVNGSEIAISGSIGIAIYPDHGKDVSELMRHADSAMYHAKDKKQGFCIYEPANDTSLGKLTLQTELRDTLDTEGFELYYQPQLSTTNNNIIAVEALGRWPHAIKGFIPPNVFISSLEQAGLINRYTYWCLEQALKKITEIHKTGHNINIAVNISTQTLTTKDFTSRIRNILSTYNKGENLIFEITENLFLSEYDGLAATLEEICNMGIKLSIDDFGTGYSSLSRLKKLPVSEIKIDKSFVMDMTIDNDDAAIVKSTIELAHNLGLTVVAEGVETEEVYTLLKLLGCDIVQGYLFSKPIPSDELNKYLEKKIIN